MSELPNSGLNTGMLGLFHAILGLLAIFFGARVFGRLSDRVRHRRSGAIYIGCISTTCITGLVMAPITGRISVFHILACAVLFAIILSMWAVMRGGKLTPARRNLHSVAMSWSYVSLWAAFLAELVVRVMVHIPNIPPNYLWSCVASVIVLTCLVGIVQIHIAPHQGVMRARSMAH